MADLVVDTPAGQKRLIGDVTLKPLPKTGDGQWHDGNAGDEPFLYYASATQIEVGVLACHQYGGNRSSVQSWGLEGIPGVVLAANEFGGPDQVHPGNFERCKRVIDKLKTDWGITKFIVCGVSGGGRMASGVPCVYPGIVGGSVVQLGIYDVAWFYEDTVARGDNGTANQLVSDCGGVPPNVISDLCSPRFFVQNASDCIFRIDRKEGDSVVTPRHQTQFFNDLNALPASANITATMRSLAGGHAPDYTWVRQQIAELIPLL